MSVSLSTFTDVSLIDSSASGGTIVLPRAGGIRYRVIVFKDRKGTFQNNPLTLNTLPGDTFEDGTTTKIFRDRFTQLWLYSDGTSVWNTLSGTQLAAMTVSSMTVSSIRGDGSLLTNLNAISSLTLQSTLQGLGTLGFLSTASLLSTVAGLGTASYVSTASLVSTTASLLSQIQTSGAISTPNLISTVAGLGSATYISSAQLLSTTASYARAFQTLSASVSSLTASNVYASTLNVDNLIIGTGLGFINIGPLQATAISTIQVNTNALYANSNYFGTTSSQTALQFFGLTGSFSNTVIAEQSTGTGTQELLLYKVSSSADRIRMQTTGSIVFEPGVSARIWPAAPSNATPAMIIDTASNVGIGTAAPGSLLDVVGQGRFLTVSTQALWASSINGATPLNPTQLISTVAGLGSAAYVSTLSLVSTTASLQTQIQTSGYISTTTLLSTVAGLGSAGYASTTFVGNAISTFSSALGLPIYLVNIQSTIQGLGSSGYVSTSQLLSTTTGIYNFVSTFIDPAELTSTIVGLGSASFVSSLGLQARLQSTVEGLGSAGYASTSFVGNAISTFSSAIGPVLYLSSLQSTVAGLGSASYISTASLTSSLRGLGNLGYLSSINVPFISAFTVSTSRLNTSTLTFVDINTQAQQVLLVSSGVLTLNGNAIGGGAGGGSGLTASDFVVAGRLAADQNLTADADTTIQFIKDYDPQNWYNATNYRFTPTIAGYYSVSFQVWFNPLVTNNNQNNIQIVKNGTDTYSITQLAQWSTTGASLNTTKIIYMNGTDYLRFQAYVGNSSNTTAKAQFGGNAYGSGTFFTAALLTNGSSGGNLISTTVGLGSIGYISTSQLVSTTFALQNQFQTTGYISSLNLVSTVAGLGSAGYASTSFVGNAISTFSTALGPGDIYLPALVSSVAGLGSAGYASTTFVGNAISTFSTAQGQVINQAALSSTIQGLATVGYISTSQLVSTVAGLGTGGLAAIPPFLSSLTLSTGFITAMTVSSQQILTSSISGNQSIFQTLSSQSLTVSSFFTATRQMTPMFVVF